MNFEGQYLTYSEYQTLGGTLEETPFNLLEFEARRKIDEKTLNRLKDIDSVEIPEEVKICDFKMINRIEEYSKALEATAKGVSSENIDGYSVSYITTDGASAIVKSKNDEFNDLINTYLFGVIVNNEHLIYAGLD